MKIKILFAWYDIWVGVFIDKKKKCLYFFPIPMLGLKISWGAEENGEGCEYCNGTEVEYQWTHNTRLHINTFGQARTIVTECNPCPPYAQCALKDVPARSAFPINFCPECGRDLRT